MMAHFNQLVLPNVWAEGVPSGVTDVLMTALAKKPGDRYATAGEMAAALTRLVKDELAEPSHTVEEVGPDTGPRLPEAVDISVQLPPFVQEGSFLKADSKPAEYKRTVLVDREGELARLDSFLESTLAGRGQVVFVTGEAGQGKTSLLKEFVLRAHETQPNLIAASGICDVYTGIGNPYLPFRDVLSMLTGDVETQWAAGTISRDHALRLWHLIPQTVEALVERGPDLIETFVSGKALASRAAAYAAAKPDRWQRLTELAAHLTGPSEGQDPDQSRLFEEYMAVLAALASQQPLLLILDDLHWADLSSISLLDHLGRRITEHPMLIVGAYRPEDVAQGREDERHPLAGILSEFKSQFGDVWVSLDRAVSTRGRAFIDAFLDTEPNRFDEKFRQELAAHTGGHPLFTVELLRDMQDRGDVVQDEQNRWVIGSNLKWEAFPARVEGVIEKRLSRLDSELLEVLTVASVEGEEFTAEVIARVRQIELRQLIRRLSSELGQQQRLVQDQGILRVGSRRLSRYRFRHNLFQKYLYQSLGEVERAYLHEDVGRVLEELYGDRREEIVVVALQLARHFQTAGVIEKAIDYLQQVGEQAVRLSANEEALVHFYKALALLETQPETTERARQELTLQIALITPLAGAKGYGSPELKVVYTRAKELSGQVGEPGQLFLVLYGLWGHNLVTGELRTALELAVQCLSLAQGIQEPALLMEAHRMMDETSFYRGELIAAREYLEQTLSLYDPQQHHAHATLYGQDPGVASFSHGSLILWYLGYPDQALKMGQEAVTLGEELSHPFSLDFALCTVAWLHQMCRDAKKVEELVGRAINLSIEYDFIFWLAIATIMHGRLMFDQGQTETGIGQMRQGLANYKALSINVNRPYLAALLAEAYGQVGQAEEGLTLLVEALTIVEKGELLHEAELYRLKGELLLQDENRYQKDESSPEGCFHKAIEIARRQSAKSLELRATVSLCRLWAKQGKKEEARRMLAEIYGWFTEGFDTLDLKEARALHEELG
jgi:predicted ATPase